MSKILLVNTLPHRDYWLYTTEPMHGMPLGLLSLATVLSQAGHQPVIVDPVVEPDYLEKIRMHVADCLWVGISAMTNGIASACQISKFVKELRPDLPICWGGVHPTLFAESVVTETFVDFACWGEGERFALELTHHLEGGLPARDIQGLAHKLDGEPRLEPRQYFLDINEIPAPNYSLVDSSLYLRRRLLVSPYVEERETTFISVNTGTGCPYNCTFCWNTHPSQKHRLKSAERVLAELDEIVRTFDPDVIHLQDDLFFASKNRFFKFLDAYESRGYRFKWYTLCRVNYFRDDYLTDEVLARMAPSCLWLGFGVESGSEQIRKRLRKEITEEQVLRAAKSLARHGIHAGFAFMTGLPFETFGDTLSTLKLMDRIRACHPRADFTFQYYRPYPGSPLYQEATENGFIPPADSQGWSMLEDPANTGGVRLDLVPWFNSVTWRYSSGVVDLLINRSYRRFLEGEPYLYVLSAVQAALLRLMFTLRLRLGFWRALGLELGLLPYWNRTLYLLLMGPEYVRRLLFRPGYWAKFANRLRALLRR